MFAFTTRLLHIVLRFWQTFTNHLVHIQYAFLHSRTQSNIVEHSRTQSNICLTMFAFTTPLLCFDYTFYCALVDIHQPFSTLLVHFLVDFWQMFCMLCYTLSTPFTILLVDIQYTFTTLTTLFFTTLLQHTQYKLLSIYNYSVLATMLSVTHCLQSSRKVYQLLNCVPSVNITPVECSRTIINLLYFSHPPKHTFLSGQAHLPYIDISSHPPKHTFLSGQAHLPYVDINSHSPKHTFLSGRAHLPYIDISSHSPKHTFLSGRAHLPYVDISSHSPKHTFLSR